MTTPAQAVANAEASLRLEGLQPSEHARQLAAAWARGEISDEDLIAAEQQLLATARLSAAPAA